MVQAAVLAVLAIVLQAHELAVLELQVKVTQVQEITLTHQVHIQVAVVVVLEPLVLYRLLLTPLVPVVLVHLPIHLGEPLLQLGKMLAVLITTLVVVVEVITLMLGLTRLEQVAMAVVAQETKLLLEMETAELLILAVVVVEN
jgi:hypothetical protein